VLPAWRDATLFSDRERAALTLAESVTTLPDARTQDQDYAEAARHLTEDELDLDLQNPPAQRVRADPELGTDPRARRGPAARITAGLQPQPDRSLPKLLGVLPVVLP
jgi:hypothetical protein